MKQAPTCREIAAALAEPREGTAPAGAGRWLLIEHRPAWGSHVINDIVPAPMRQQLRAHGITPIAVRAPGSREAAGPCRLWLTHADGAVARWQAADSGTRDAHVQRVAESGSAPTDAVADEDPMLLVCTNGKRDACCALLGRDIVDGAQSRHRQRVWECSHLGGHRFAGVALLLPSNYAFHCESAADADAVLDLALQSALRRAGLRGRSGISAAHQAAEIAAREVWQQWRLDFPLTMTDESDAVVVTDAQGNSLRIGIEAGQGPVRPESCGGEGKPMTWVRAHTPTRR